MKEEENHICNRCKKDMVLKRKDGTTFSFIGLVVEHTKPDKEPEKYFVMKQCGKYYGVKIELCWECWINSLLK